MEPLPEEPATIQSASPEDDDQVDRFVADLKDRPQRIPAVRIVRIGALFFVADEFGLLPHLVSLPIFVAMLFIGDLFVQKCMAHFRTRDLGLLFFPRLAADRPLPLSEHRTRLALLALLVPAVFILLSICFMTIGILQPHILITETAMICAFFAVAQLSPLPGCAANRLFTRLFYARWNWLQLPITLLVAGPPAFFNLTGGYFFLGAMFVAMIVVAAVETNHRRIARRASVADTDTDRTMRWFQGHKVSEPMLLEILQLLPANQRSHLGRTTLDTVSRVVDQVRIRPPRPVASVALFGAFFVSMIVASALASIVPFSSDEAFPVYRARFEAARFDGQAMHMVAAVGRPDWVRSAIEAGEDVNARDNRGATPLYWSIERGHFDAAEFLLEHGADLSLALDDGKTCLMAAAERGDVRLVELLIARGADPHRKDGDGKTALGYGDLVQNVGLRKQIKAALTSD